MDIIIVVHRKRSYGASFRDISIDILPGIDFLPCKLRLFRKDPVCREFLEKLLRMNDMKHTFRNLSYDSFSTASIEQSRHCRMAVRDHNPIVREMQDPEALIP